MFYYVNYKDNWADEMFVEGFSIMDEKEYEHYTATVNAIITDIECGLPFVYQIGTNEEIEYNNVNDFLSAFEVSEFEEYPEGIEMVFGKKFPEFGFFPYGQMLDVFIKVSGYSNTEIDAQIETFEEHFATEYYNQYNVFCYPETTQIYKELYEEEMNLNGNE